MCIRDRSISIHGVETETEPRALRDQRRGGIARALQGDPQGFELVALGGVADGLGDRFVHGVENIDDTVEVEQDGVLHARRLRGDDAGKPALDKESPHTFQIASHVGEGEIATPERGEARPGPFGGLAKRPAELLIAHQLDARGEGLEQFERDVLRRPIERVAGTWTEKELAVLGPFTPALGNGAGDPIDIVRDARGEPAAEADLLRPRRECVGALAVEQIFQRRKSLEGHAFLGKRIRQQHRSVPLGKNGADLAQTDALRVRPEEQALVAMVLVDRSEPEDLDLAPTFHGLLRPRTVGARSRSAGSVRSTRTIATSACSSGRTRRASVCARSAPFLPRGTSRCCWRIRLPRKAWPSKDFRRWNICSTARAPILSRRGRRRSASAAGSPRASRTMLIGSPAPLPRAGVKGPRTASSFSVQVPATRFTGRRRTSRSNCSRPSPLASSWCAIRSSAGRSASPQNGPGRVSPRSGVAISPSPTWLAIWKVCGLSLSRAGLPASSPRSRLAWRTPSCSTSTVSSIFSTPWTNRSPRPSATPPSATSSKPCGSP